MVKIKFKRKLFESKLSINECLQEIAKVSYLGVIPKFKVKYDGLIITKIPFHLCKGEHSMELMNYFVYNDNYKIIKSS